MLCRGKFSGFGWLAHRGISRYLIIMPGKSFCLCKVLGPFRIKLIVPIGSSGFEPYFSSFSHVLNSSWNSGFSFGLDSLFILFLGCVEENPVFMAILGV